MTTYESLTVILSLLSLGVSIIALLFDHNKH